MNYRGINTAVSMLPPKAKVPVGVDVGAAVVHWNAGTMRVVVVVEPICSCKPPSTMVIAEATPDEVVTVP